MIIERITAVRLIPPRTVVTDVPVARHARPVETMRVVGVSERQHSIETDGSILDVSYSDIETGTYVPADVTVYQRRTHTMPR